MNQLIKLVEKYQKEESDIILNLIFEKIKPMLIKYRNKVPKFYQDDLNQEMLMRTHKLIKDFKINSNYKIILVNEENIDYKLIENNLYLQKFLKIYQRETLDNSKLNQEYNLFCNEKQFINCLNIRLKSTYIDFIKKNKNYINQNIISLNQINLENIEMIDAIIDDFEPIETLLLGKHNLTNDELNFILEFMEKGRILSETKVGKKLGISQQAVNKRKKKIINKYKK